MTKVHLPLHEIPAVIRESARSVLNAHGFDLVPRPDGTNVDDEKIGEPLNERQLERLLSEIGRNAAQALVSIDENPDNR